jgi:anti-sigma factor RsiW
MADILCGYTADRDETLTAYLYGEIDPVQRATFDAHIATCERCRKELAELQGVRLRLQEWSAPEVVRSIVRMPAGAAIPADRPPAASTGENGVPRAWARMHDLPVWAQTAAALLFLGVSAGIANLDVHYDQRGLSIRTGWSRTPGASVMEGPAAGPATPPAAGSPAAAPWRADLTALERQLRTEFHGLTPAPTTVMVRDAAAAAADPQLLKRLRALVEDSERKQQNELALRLAELSGEWEAKRKNDLKNIDWNLQAIQKDTGFRMATGQKQMREYIDQITPIIARTQPR